MEADRGARVARSVNETEAISGPANRICLKFGSCRLAPNIEFTSSTSGSVGSSARCGALWTRSPCCIPDDAPHTARGWCRMQAHVRPCLWLVAHLLGNSSARTIGSKHSCQLGTSVDGCCRPDPVVNTCRNPCEAPIAAMAGDPVSGSQACGEDSNRRRLSDGSNFPSDRGRAGTGCAI